jgi:hypothetical protein
MRVCHPRFTPRFTPVHPGCASSFPIDRDRHTHRHASRACCVVCCPIPDRCRKRAGTKRPRTHQGSWAVARRDLAELALAWAAVCFAGAAIILF